MEKTKLEIYALFVCFVTMLCLSVYLGKSVYDLIKINLPQYTVEAWDDPSIESNETFCRNLKMRAADKFDCEKKTEAEITQIRAADYKYALAKEAKNGKQDLIFSLISMVINLLIFILHWKIARTSREH